MTENYLADNVPSEILDMAVSYMPTGSSYTCDPPVLDTDKDFVMLAFPGAIPELRGLFELFGWDDCSKRNDECTAPMDDENLIVRRGDINLIVTSDPNRYECWRISTVLAKRFNLLNKIDRQDLFSAVRERRLVSESIS